MTAAYYLGLEGIKVDIFEELPVLGGEVAVGVPEYRMPIGKYNKDIELVSSLETVTIYTNHRVDAKRLKELDKEYDAVLLWPFWETKDLFLKKGWRGLKKRKEGRKGILKGVYWGLANSFQIGLWTKRFKFLWGTKVIRKLGFQPKARRFTWRLWKELKGLVGLGGLGPGWGFSTPLQNWGLVRFQGIGLP